MYLIIQNSEDETFGETLNTELKLADITNWQMPPSIMEKQLLYANWNSKQCVSHMINIQLTQ